MQWAGIVAQTVKYHLHCGRPGSIPGSGRSPGEGNGFPLQYFGLENSMDCIVRGIAKGWTPTERLYLQCSHIFHKIYKSKIFLNLIFIL